MKIVNFIRRLIAFPFSLVGIIVLLTALIVAIPFILIGKVIAPTDEQESSADTIKTFIQLLDKFSNDDDDEENKDSNDTPSIAF